MIRKVIEVDVICGYLRLYKYKNENVAYIEHLDEIVNEKLDVSLLPSIQIEMAKDMIDDLIKALKELKGEFK